MIHDIWGNLEEKATEFRAQEVKALRYNEGKLKWSYVHFASLEPMVRVLEFGAKKYEPFNWQKGLKKDEVLESIQRHLAKLIDGEQIDPESGISHMGHIQCNAMFWNYIDAKEKEQVQHKPIVKPFLGDLLSGKNPDYSIRQG